MNQLVIDLGSYSLKFIETFPERKGTRLISYQEISLDRFRQDLGDEVSLQEIQFTVLAKYLAKTEFRGKTITQIPNEMMTTRFLELPVPNKRKAELMIPFQLEENLPFGADNIHLTSQIHKKEKSSFAQVTVVEKDYFSELYQYLDSQNILPAVITTELYSLQSFLSHHKMTGNYCFLDIGHETTKAYFVHNGLIVSNHISHIAGASIDEVIAQTYDIPLDEAVVYKQDNGFFLTEDQYDDVNEDQKKFARLMKQTFWPLVLEIRRWEVGHRIKHGPQIEKIFLTGGTAQIKNLDKFLSEHTHIPVEIFYPYSDLNYDMVGIDEEDMNSMAVAQVMNVGQSTKVQAPSLLHGGFSSKFTDSIPLHSNIFVASRVSVVCVLVLLTLLVEYLFISQDIKALDRSIVNELQDRQLDIPRRIRDQYRVRPKVVMNEIKKKHKTVEQEVELVQSATKKQALETFVGFHQSIPSNRNIDLTKIVTDGVVVESQFSSQKKSELKKLQDHLMTLGKNDSDIQLKKGNNQLKFSYRED